MDVGAVREAIAQQLSNALEVRVYPRLVEAPQYPCVTIYPGDPFIPESNRTMHRSSFSLVWRVAIICSAAGGDDQAQQAIDRLLSTNDPDHSVWDALRDDRTFGGAVDGSHVTGEVNYGPSTVGREPNEEPVWMAELTVFTQVTEVET